MLNIIPIKQKKSYWCGPTSLKMVLKYYGLEVKDSVLAKQAKVSPETGVTAEALLETAKTYGLTGFIKNQAELSDLEHYVLDKKIPIIVDWFHISDGHYSVVTDINSKHIYLADPFTGNLISIKRNRFYRIWFDFPGPYLSQKADLNLRQLIIIQKKQAWHLLAMF